MVVKRNCTFCAGEIEPGTGTMFVKRDGTVFTFCTSSCRKQQLHLGRVGHRFKWTRAYELKRAAEHANAAARAPPAPVKAAPAPPASVGTEADDAKPPAEAAPAAAKATPTKGAGSAPRTKTGGARPKAKPKPAQA